MKLKQWFYLFAFILAVGNIDNIADFVNESVSIPAVFAAILIFSIIGIMVVVGSIVKDEKERSMYE